MFVIVRSDGAYVAPPGQDKSYTTRLEDAWTFTDREKAQKQCCVENETVRDVRDLMNS